MPPPSSLPLSLQENIELVRNSVPPEVFREPYATQVQLTLDRLIEDAQKLKRDTADATKSTIYPFDDEFVAARVLTRYYARAANALAALNNVKIP